MKLALRVASVAVVAGAIGFLAFDLHATYARRKELVAIRDAVTSGMSRQAVAHVITTLAKRTIPEDDPKVPFILVHEARWGAPESCLGPSAF